MSTSEKTESTIMDRWLDDEDDFEVVEISYLKDGEVLP